MNKLIFLQWAKEKNLPSAIDRARAFGVNNFQLETWIIAFLFNKE